MFTWSVDIYIYIFIDGIKQMWMCIYIYIDGIKQMWMCIYIYTHNLFGG